MIGFASRGKLHVFFNSPKNPKWVKCLLACIPSIILIVLGVWSIFHGEAWQFKALGGLLVLISILFAVYVCVKITADGEKKND